MRASRSDKKTVWPRETSTTLSWWGMCPSVPHLGYATGVGNGFRVYHYKLFAKNSDNSEGKLTFKDSALKEINYLGPVEEFLAIQLL